MAIKNSHVGVYTLVAIALFAFNLSADAQQVPWQVDPVPNILHQDVSFSNGDARLAGTLYLPALGDHLPAVVVLQGADVPTREYALYRHLSEGLPAIGIAVLIYDRRGSGASSGTLNGASYEVLADDAIAGAKAIGRNPRIDPNRVGFWGLSQGGWLAVLAAGRDRNAAFAVSVSAPLVTASRQMYFAVADELRVNGYSAQDIDAATKTRDAWEGYLRGTRSREDAVRALTAVENKPWFHLTFMPKAKELAATPKESTWRLQMDDDPMRAVGQVSAPLLLIYGGRDPWIPVGTTIALLRERSKNQRNLEYKVIANASHEMSLGKSETMAFDKQTLLASAPDAPAYFLVLASWLAAHAYSGPNAPRSK